jgi:S-DNA-T family DNA segregation ATPase FtsK/SpoIIIE
LLRGTPPLEFQAALPSKGLTDEEQFQALKKLAADMNSRWKGSRPPEIRSLPLLVTLPEFEASVTLSSEEVRGSFYSVLGQDYETLSPIGLSLEDDGPTFMIASTSPQSGKTSVLQTWILGLVERFSPQTLRLILPDYHSRTLMGFRSLPHVMAYIDSMSSLEASLSRFSEEVESRQRALESAYEKDPNRFSAQDFVRQWSHHLVVIDDYDIFSARAENASNQLAEIVSVGGDLGVSVIVAGNTSELPRDYDDPLMQRIRRHGCGLLLSGSEGLEQFNNAR